MGSGAVTLAKDSVDRDGGSGMETGSDAPSRSGMSGISMVPLVSGAKLVSSSFAASDGNGSCSLGSCGVCMRGNGVIGIGPRAMPVPGGGDWIDRKNGSPRTSLAGRPRSPIGGSSIFGAPPPRGVDCGGAGATDPR